MLSFDELWKKLTAGDESVEIEVKAGREVGKSALETVSAFSNEPDRGGGYLIFGVTEDEDSLFCDLAVTGVTDPERIQTDLATMCASQITPSVRPQIEVAQHSGKTVVIAFVPEAAKYDKPVHITSRGPQAGSFRRIGSTDQRCTDDDLSIFYQSRGSKSFDESAIDDASLQDIDPAAVREYRRLRQEVNPNAVELSLPDEDLLYSIGAVIKQNGTARITVAGLLLFGSGAALRRLFPLTRVDYIRVEGREWIEDPDQRFQTIEFRGPLLSVIPRIVAQVFDDIPKAFSLPDGSIYRKDVPAIPLKVVREAVVNLVMHRSYRTRQPSQIIRYANRIEMRNPGVSLVPDDRLGEPGSQTRNEKVAAVLHEVNLAETKGSGIRVMRELMRRANLTAPLFESDRQKDLFTVTILVHHLFGTDDLAWLSQFKDCDLSDEDARALMLLRETGALNNAAYRDVNAIDTLSASRRLHRFCKLGLTEKKGQGNNTYYVPGRRLKNSATLSDQSRESNPLDSSQSRELNPLDKRPSKPQTSRQELLSLLPSELAETIKRLPLRGGIEAIRGAILELCRVRPFMSRDLSLLVRRDPEYLKHQFLGPMVREGALRYAYLNRPAHPRQAYITNDPESASAERP